MSRFTGTSRALGDSIPRQAARAEVDAVSREEAVIAQRRRCEEARKARIFDAKFRTMSLDTAALDQQVEIRRRAEEEERQRDRLYAEQGMAVEKAVMQREREAAEARRQMTAQVSEYRQALQTRDLRKEYDLYDPQARARDLPARVGDDDPRLGPSSLQKFDGEDLRAAQRRREQQEQLRTWIAQQLDEKQLARMQERDEDAEVAARTMHQTRALLDYQSSESEARRQVSEQTAAMNLRLAEERATEERLRRRQEDEERLHEIQNQLHSQVLTEDRAATQHAFAKNRFVPYNFKGLPAERVQEILDEQHSQREELRLRRESEKAAEEAEAANAMRVQRELLLREREAERQARAMRQGLAREHEQQAAEFRQRESFMNREVYRNEVRPDFFDQFNTSSR